jgi:pilus assembly protein CpaB
MDAVMTRQQISLIAGSTLVLGALIMYAAQHVLRLRAIHARREVDVVIAARYLQVGTAVLDQDLTLTRFQAADAPADSFHDKLRILGRSVLLPISKGSALFPYELGGYGDPLMTMAVGMRAVSIRASGVVDVAHSVQSGTRVDVFVIGTPRRGGKEQSTTLLKNVTVIATGQSVERNSGGDVPMVPTVTLLLLPDDARKLAAAKVRGRFQLSPNVLGKE